MNQYTSNLELYLQFRTDQMREAMEQLVYRYTLAIYRDARKHAEQLIEQAKSDLLLPNKV